MKESPTHIESLICRSLDGALTEEEQLELNRELIRNQESQAMFDAYRRADALAESAMDASIPDREQDMNPEMWIAGVDQSVALRIRRGWWLVPGTIAAALLAVAFNHMLHPIEREASAPSLVGAIDRVPEFVVRDPVHQEAMSHPVSMEPRRRIQRDIARDIYDILGDNGRIYRIEVDRAHILKRNSERTRRDRSSLEM